MRFVRYDKQIFFVKEGEEVYDYDTGDYVTSEPIKHEAWANVSDTGTERMQLIYGALKQGAITVRIRGKYEKEFDYILVDDKKYNVDAFRTFRNDQAFNLSEQL